MACQLYNSMLQQNRQAKRRFRIEALGGRSWLRTAFCAVVLVSVSRPAWPSDLKRTVKSNPATRAGNELLRVHRGRINKAEDVAEEYEGLGTYASGQMIVALRADNGVAAATAVQFDVVEREPLRNCVSTSDEVGHRSPPAGGRATVAWP